MRKIILHIPHSSSHIPFFDGYAASETELKAEMLKLTDWHTEDLFQHDQAIQVVAPFSRIFCDTERFPDDAMEVMAQYGMGMLYEKFDDGRPLRNVDASLREKIMNNYYLVHHNNLLKKVEEQLSKYNKCLIIDCHSFPDRPFNRDLDKTQPRPDYNLGTDEYHTSGELLEVASLYFKERGFSLGINEPYSGSIVPLKYYQKDAKVQSIMLEVNRKLYLKDGSNENNLNYWDTKKTVQEFIAEIANNFSA